MKNDLTLLPIRNAQVSYAESIPFVRSAEVLLQELIAQIEWEHKDVVIQGRSYKQPRLTAWHGDPGMAYTYSGLANQPKPWTPLLEAIKMIVEAAAGCTFNSALLNLYRSEAHTSEPQSLMRISYAVFCLKKKKKQQLNPIKS